MPPDIVLSSYDAADAKSSMYGMFTITSARPGGCCDGLGQVRCCHVAARNEAEAVVYSIHTYYQWWNPAQQDMRQRLLRELPIAGFLVAILLHNPFETEKIIRTRLRINRQHCRICIACRPKANVSKFFVGHTAGEGCDGDALLQL